MSITSEIINATKTGQAKALQKNAKKYTDSLSQITTQQNKELTKATNKQIEGTRQAVQRSYDLNALNEEIQAQQVSDRMASLGLTDSGLNLTQQTALASSRINADAQVSQNYNNAVAVLRSNLQTAIAKNNRALQANVAQVNYNTGVDVATIKSGLKGGAKQTTQALISTITSTTDKAKQAKTIFSAAQTYGLSQTSVDRLLAMTNISKKEYQAYLKDRKYFSKKADSTGSGSSGTGGGKPKTGYVGGGFDFSKYENMSRGELDGISEDEKKQILNANGVEWSRANWDEYLDYTYGEFDATTFDGWTYNDFAIYINKIIRNQGVNEARNEVEILSQNGVISSSYKSKLMGSVITKAMITNSGKG